MELNITSDSPGNPTPTGQLTINKNQINTNVLVDNGETVVLGVFLSKKLEMHKLKFLSWEIFHI